MRHRLEATTATCRRVLLGSFVTATLTLAVTALGAPAPPAPTPVGHASRPPGSAAAPWTSPRPPPRSASGSSRPAPLPRAGRPHAHRPADDVADVAAPRDPADGDVVYDGTEVQVRLSQRRRRRPGRDAPGHAPAARGRAPSPSRARDVLAARRLRPVREVRRSTAPSSTACGPTTSTRSPFTVTEGPPPTTVEVADRADPARDRHEPGAGAGRAAHPTRGHAGRRRDTRPRPRRADAAEHR